ncbi:MAG: InlB B-repeat-containing protein, partial [Lachnospiraceae bacterium]|nr:InlB B-repeat-containing protein [Lachnospiraceae bacterium]
TFWDWNATLLDTQEISAGQDATPPAVPGRPGYIHTGWVPDYHGINSDLQITAQYEAEDPDAHKFTVTFLDFDDTVLKTTLVAPGADAEPPIDPKRDGYMFTGWRPAITNIQQDTTIYAQYEKLDSTTTQFVVRFIDYNDTVLYTQKVNPGESAILPQSPVREGYTFTGWRPAITNITKDTDTYAQYEKNLNTDSNNGNNGNNNNNGNDGTNGGNGTTSSKVYNLTVRNGSGSGSYAAGSQPIIIADDPAKGKVFSNWTIAPAGTKIASKVLSATVVTMPEGDVVVTAHYKNADSDTTTNNRPNSGTNVSGGGTTVVIDKNGLSNTGVVSATINGSSDNFTIKISESSVAAEQALKALKAKFGDISGIKYFPFDISLYDSKGTKKIYDTTGLSIKVTLPLPDSLVPYAGNSKVASVADGKLESLSAKFNTISGVPCITFTCEHFSPYVIYVNTDNLMAGGDVSGGGNGNGSGSGGGASDDTPKTGDGIHPKWFLSMGLSCVAFVLFMKRDKRQLQTAKVVKK